MTVSEYTISDRGINSPERQTIRHCADGLPGFYESSGYAYYGGNDSPASAPYAAAPVSTSASVRPLFCSVSFLSLCFSKNNRYYRAFHQANQSFCVSF